HSDSEGDQFGETVRFYGRCPPSCGRAILLEYGHARLHIWHRRQRGSRILPVGALDFSTYHRADLRVMQQLQHAEAHTASVPSRAERALFRLLRTRAFEPHLGAAPPADRHVRLYGPADV